jgi:hypothetical protein
MPAPSEAGREEVLIMREDDILGVIENSFGCQATTVYIPRRN